ncbi:hypothetical protein EST38_g6317 [Candolleomyces aberdarensis]|uniref:Large ribosomal subunit protein mL59 domain-containing protein n=1 Tax=Candolleomyces aberdarensis TaxID=2316362 RepID=A0A4Q2DL96_9AGAR|nr:hypothetical protein EST38_g6317 [Candolleomyces aberdarensis]
MASATVTARKSIEGFLAREIRQKSQHIARFGPLQPLTETAATQTKASGSQVTGVKLPNPFLPQLNANTGRWAPAKYSLRQQADLVKKAKSAGLLQHLPPGPKTPILDPTHANVQKYNPQVAAVVSAAFEAQQKSTSKKLRKAVLPQLSQESWTATAPEKGSILNKAVRWTGKIDLHRKAGADTGIKLYAGKKRMFKGHRWERLKDARERRQSILMRDMAARIRTYKEYYKKKRPNPLKPPKNSLKGGKIPF